MKPSNGIGGSKPLMPARMYGLSRSFSGVAHADYPHHQAVGGKNAQQGSERDLMQWLFFLFCGTVFNLVGCAIKLGKNPPRLGKWIGQLVYTSPRCVRLYSMASKDNVSDKINFRIWLTCMIEFELSHPLYLNKDLGNLPPPQMPADVHQGLSNRNELQPELR